jgi:aspartokinase-like uncharacterized kinase
MQSPSQAGAVITHRYPTPSVCARVDGCERPGSRLDNSWRVVANTFCFFISPVTATDITVWIISALLAIGIGLSKYSKWRTRNKLVRDLAAMDQERREKVLSRMNPELAMEARQELMRRFHIG